MLLILVVLVCCSIGISRNDINLKVTHVLKYCLKNCRTAAGDFICPLVVEMAYTAPQSWKTRSGYQLPLLGVIVAICWRLKGVLSSTKVAAFHS